MHHLINGSIFHDRHECKLDISIDGQVVHAQTYASGIKHDLDIRFQHQYQDNSMHEMVLHFDSTVETSNKYVMIDAITINHQPVSVANAYYKPKQTAWWNGSAAKDALSTKVYQHGNYFGWCGTIHVYYYINTNSYDSWQSALGIIDPMITSDPAKSKSKR